ncbi:MAG: PxxKW family cysteine-rich protein [Desulfobulbaceae bacterium]|nr:PxxKW family cysteine-rich protein [Desulfobulbaceae bacterium]
MAKAKAKAASTNQATAADTAMYTNGSFSPIIDKCDGCERAIDIEATKYCKSYKSPEAKWRLGICNFATHVKPEITVAKIRVNPLKASKRASGKG